MNSSSPKVGGYGQKEIIMRKELKPFLKRTDINGLVQAGLMKTLLFSILMGWLSPTRQSLSQTFKSSLDNRWKVVSGYRWCSAW